MKKFAKFRNFFSVKFPRLFALLKLIRLAVDRKSFIHRDGIWRSLVSDRPQDCFGRPVPWFNTGARRFIEDRLKENFRILEFGAGASTLFFQNRVREVVSIEHSRYWVSQLSSKIGNNVHLVHVNGDTEEHYVAPLISNSLGMFELVLVDGIFRGRCCLEALSCLTEDGVIILDDSSRSDYDSIFKQLEMRDFKSIRISGIKPGGYSIDETTIFYRQSNCLLI